MLEDEIKEQERAYKRRRAERMTPLEVEALIDERDSLDTLSADLQEEMEILNRVTDEFSETISQLERELELLRTPAIRIVNAEYIMNRVPVNSDRWREARAEKEDAERALKVAVELSEKVDSPKSTMTERTRRRIINEGGNPFYYGYGFSIKVEEPDG